MKLPWIKEKALDVQSKLKQYDPYHKSEIRDSEEQGSQDGTEKAPHHDKRIKRNGKIGDKYEPDPNKP
jgi:hypothetical protein